MPPKKKAAQAAGSPSAAPAERAGTSTHLQSDAASAPSDVVGKPAPPAAAAADDPAPSELVPQTACSPRASLQHLLHLFCYSCAVFVVLREDVLFAATRRMLSLDRAHVALMYTPYAACFLYTSCVFYINYRSRSLLASLVLAAMALLAAWLLCFSTAIPACLSAVMTAKDYFHREVPSSAPIFHAFEVAIFGAEGSVNNSSSDLKATPFIFQTFMHCVTRESVVAATLTFLLSIVTFCTVHKGKWISSFIISSLLYNTLLRVVGISRLLAEESSTGDCTTTLCSGLGDFMRCNVGAENLWTFEASQVVISAFAIFICLKEPFSYLLGAQLSTSASEFLHRVCAATSSLLAVIAIFARTFIFKHISDTFGDPKFLLFFLRPVMYFTCICCIEYGVSVCILKKDSSTLQLYARDFERVVLEKLQHLNALYVSNFISKDSQSQSILKRSNTSFTYACAAAIAMLLLVLNFIDPITGRGGVLHQILEAFWLDFDIIVELSGPLTLLLVVAAYTAWLTNGAPSSTSQRFPQVFLPRFFLLPRFNLTPIVLSTPLLKPSKHARHALCRSCRCPAVGE